MKNKPVVMVFTGAAVASVVTAYGLSCVPGALTALSGDKDMMACLNDQVSTNVEEGKVFQSVGVDSQYVMSVGSKDGALASVVFRSMDGDIFATVNERMPGGRIAYRISASKHKGNGVWENVDRSAFIESTVGRATQAAFDICAKRRSLMSLVP